MNDRLAIMQQIQKCSKDTIVPGTHRPAPVPLTPLQLAALSGLQQSTKSTFGTGMGLGQPFSSMGGLLSSIGPSGLHGPYQNQLHG